MSKTVSSMNVCVSLCVFLLSVKMWDKRKKVCMMYVCEEDREICIRFPLVNGDQSDVPSCPKQSG